MRNDPRNGDPRLKTRSWRAIVNAWTRLQPVTCEATPCLLPGKPITYTHPRTRTSLDVGHLIPRALDPSKTWTIDQTRPEHQYCSRSHGQQVKKQLNKAIRIKTTEQAKSARKW